LSQMLIGGLLKVSTLPETAPTNRTFTPTAIEQVKGNLCAMIILPTVCLWTPTTGGVVRSICRWRMHGFGSKSMDHHRWACSNGTQTKVIITLWIWDMNPKIQINVIRI
jgi:hypothetical protein